MSKGDTDAANIVVEALKILQNRHKDLLAEIDQINISAQCLINIGTRSMREGFEKSLENMECLRHPTPKEMPQQPTDLRRGPVTGRKGSVKALAYEALKSFDGIPCTYAEIRERIRRITGKTVVPVTLRGALTHSPDLFQKTNNRWSLKHE